MSELYLCVGGDDPSDSEIVIGIGLYMANSESEACEAFVCAQMGTSSYGAWVESLYGGWIQHKRDQAAAALPHLRPSFEREIDVFVGEKRSDWVAMVERVKAQKVGGAPIEVLSLPRSLSLGR